MAATPLVLAREEARLGDVAAALLDAHVRVAADVAQDGVHAGQLDAGADDGVVLVRHRVEVGHAPALLQDLVVGRREQAVGETVPVEEEEGGKGHSVSWNWDCTSRSALTILGRKRN